MKAYRFSFVSRECLNCGICVDVCPLRSLDMTRPQSAGPEPEGQAPDAPCADQGWMTVSPVQIGRCSGCMICAMECPMDVIRIDEVEGDFVLAPPQGVLVREPKYDPAHWQALSDFTRVSHKDRPLGDPWGSAHKWRPVRRDEAWRVWRTWETRETPARTVENAKTRIDKE